jgi:predicted molibdopterin-dependent oxidoreductase YjgC
LVNRTGKLQPVSWAEALDWVAESFQSLIATGKSVGVLGSARATNEENYLAGKLARAYLRTNNLDFSYHPVCGPLLRGIEDVCGSSFPSVSLRDIESSQTILLIEGDLAYTHPQVALSVLRAVEKGARLITLGCVRTQLARLASLHLQVAPGSESVAINALLAGVLNSPSMELSSVALGSEGLEMLRKGMASVSVTEEARQVAAWFARARQAVILMVPTFGPDQTRKNAAALATLAALTGHLGKSGSGLLPLLGRSNVRGACDMGLAPDRLPDYEPLERLSSRQRLQAIWGRKVPHEAGEDAENILQSVRGLICVADDPPSVLPGGLRAMELLSKIEFLVILDAFSTPTSQIASAVLPIASFAETEGTVTNLEGRVQRLHAAAEPPGEARPGWQVLAEFCRRFGVGAKYSSVRDVFSEVTQAAPRYADLDRRLLEEEWGAALPANPDGSRYVLHAASGETPESTGAYVLASDSAYDWDRDPLVLFSPILSRDGQSQRKLFPNGFVDISKVDADRLGVHAGRRIKLSSPRGSAVFPVQVRADLKPGVLLMPRTFRDQIGDLLGTASATAIEVEQA